MPTDAGSTSRPVTPVSRSRRKEASPRLGREGLSFPEVLVAMIVLMFLVAGIYRTFTAATRNAKHGQETVDHIRTAAIVFRAMERDLKGLLPWDLQDGNKKLAKLYSLGPSSQDAQECTFRVFSITEGETGNLRTVTYRFDPGKKEICRIEGDAAGKEEFRFHFGPGVVESMSIRDDAGDGRLIRVKFTLGEGKGKSRQATFQRVFRSGFWDDNHASKNWVFHF